LKAETLAHAMKDFGLFAWAPGANDWARDVPAFTQLTRSSGALALAENLDREAGVERGFAVVERGGLKVGVVGISLPAFPGRELGFSVGEAKQALRRGLGALKNKGAELSIALIAAPRGEALRLVESAPELAIAVVGKPFDQGEDNDEPSEPMLLGRTLV